MPEVDLGALAPPELWLGAAFLLGTLLTGCLSLWRGRARARGAAERDRQREEQHALELEVLEARLSDRSAALERADGQIRQLDLQVDTLRRDLAERHEALAARRASEAALQARLDETRRMVAEKEALFEQNRQALRQEFEVLARSIFEHQGEQHQATLGALLAPFRDQLADFRQRVETVYTTETRDRASLLAEVRNLQQSSERINREAENLTRALKGDVKRQGNWGEMVLERVLEGSGLRAGREYLVQEAHRSSAGSLRRPDVIVRLPGDKDVVVDAKLSLVAYEQALAADEEDVRQRALREHVSSLRAHVRRLAEQDYDRLRDVRSLDFVLLFVPIEAAFGMAMEHEPKLFAEAFERRIVIVSPTTLMMTLRIIQNVWRHENQSRNAQEIAARAGALYDKLRGFVEDMDALGRQIHAAENTFQAAFAKLSSGRGNLLRQAENLRELGAPVKKPLPAHLVDDGATLAGAAGEGSG